MMGVHCVSVDASVPSAEQERRRLLRCKYTTRPNTVAVNQYSSWKVQFFPAPVLKMEMLCVCVCITYVHLTFGRIGYIGGQMVVG